MQLFVRILILGIILTVFIGNLVLLVLIYMYGCAIGDLPC